MKIKKINDLYIFNIAAALISVVSFFGAVPACAATTISVPFTSQAPAGNWAQPWQDFCEEASVVMAAHFVWAAPFTQTFAEMEMQIIRQYEEIVFKKYKDTSIAETAQILTHLFGFKNIRTRSISSLSDMKNEIAQGNIILAPAAGRLLKNPYFIPPGPLYHMIVIRGFDDNRHVFITNDPGTRRGNGLTYDQGTLFNAIHDWNGGDVVQGEKNIIVVGR